MGIYKFEWQFTPPCSMATILDLLQICTKYTKVSLIFSKIFCKFSQNGLYSNYFVLCDIFSQLNMWYSLVFKSWNMNWSIESNNFLALVKNSDWWWYSTFFSLNKFCNTKSLVFTHNLSIVHYLCDVFLPRAMVAI